MAAAAALKKQKQIPQKDEVSAPVGSIAPMTAASASIRQNNQSESPAWCNEEDRVPPTEVGIE